MAKIKLPRTVIEDAVDGVVIRHTNTGISISVSKIKLDRWAVSQFRSLMLSPALPADPQTTRPGKA